MGTAHRVSMARATADANVHAGSPSANMASMAGLPRFRRSRRAMLAILIAAFLLGVQGGLTVLPMNGDGAREDGAKGDVDAGSREALAAAPHVEAESPDPDPDFDPAPAFGGAR